MYANQLALFKMHENYPGNVTAARERLSNYIADGRYSTVAWILRKEGDSSRTSMATEAIPYDPRTDTETEGVSGFFLQAVCLSDPEAGVLLVEGIALVDLPRTLSSPHCTVWADTIASQKILQMVDANPVNWPGTLVSE